MVLMTTSAWVDTAACICFPTHPLSYVKHPLACFGNSLISHFPHSNDLPARPQGVYLSQEYKSGGVFRLLYMGGGGVYPGFCPFWLKIAPRVFCHNYYGISFSQA